MSQTSGIRRSTVIATNVLEAKPHTVIQIISKFAIRRKTRRKLQG
jgi:hypothetical protein